MIDTANKQFDCGVGERGQRKGSFFICCVYIIGEKFVVKKKKTNTLSLGGGCS